MKRFVSLRLFLGLVFGAAMILGGCDGLSSFERDNPEDPKSRAFVPRAASELMVTPKQDGTVLLRWPGASDFADGHLIEKSLGDDNSFKALATIPGRDSTFRDTTRRFERPTYYRVRPFAEEGDTRTFGERQEAPLPLGSIGALRIETNPDGTVRLAWTDSTRLEQEFQVSVAVDGGAVQRVATVPRNQSSYAYRPPALSFADTVRTYRVSAPLLGSDTTTIGTVKEGLAVRRQFAPADVSVGFPDEETARVNWTPRASFADRLLLTQVGDSATVTLDSATVALDPSTQRYVFDRVLEDGASYQYTLRAIDEDGYASAPARERAFFGIEPPALAETSGDDPGAVDLSWSHPAQRRVAGYELIRKTLGTGTVTRTTFDAGTRSYTDIDVDPDARYRYWIRTKASNRSRPRRVGYLWDYQRAYTVTEACGQSIQEHLDDAVYAPSVYVSSRGVAAHPAGTRIAAAWDSLAVLFDHDSGTVDACVPGPGGNVSSVSFRPDGNVLGIGVGGFDARENNAGVVLWDVEGRSISWRATGPRAFTTAFNPSGDRFGATGGQGEVHVWRTSDGSTVWSKPGEDATTTLRFLSFDADGTTLTTGSPIDPIRLQDASTGAVQKTFSPRAETALRYTRGRDPVLLVSRGVTGTQALDPETGEHRFTIPGRRSSVGPAGDRLAVTHWQVGADAHSVWSAPDEKSLGLVENVPRALALALSPQGGLVAWTREGVIRWTRTPKRWVALPR